MDAFSKDITVLPEHPAFIRWRNEPYPSFLPLQPKLVLVYRPRKKPPHAHNAYRILDIISEWNTVSKCLCDITWQSSGWTWSISLPMSQVRSRTQIWSTVKWKHGWRKVTEWIVLLTVHRRCKLLYAREQTVLLRANLFHVACVAFHKLFIIPRYTGRAAVLHLCSQHS